MSTGLILVIGDFHIPHRSAAIPQIFLDRFSNGKYQKYCQQEIYVEKKHMIC